MTHDRVHDFVTSYEFRGDAGDYTPTDHERVLIEDAIQAWIAERSDETLNHGSLE